jgi:hypothetical protein
MKMTLRDLAIRWAQHEISDRDVQEQARSLEPATLVRDGEDSWYEGNLDNTMVAVQALIGESITQDDFNRFVAIFVDTQ